MQKIRIKVMPRLINETRIQACGTMDASGSWRGKAFRKKSMPRLKMAMPIQ
jgi:hypothetical protein